MSQNNITFNEYSFVLLKCHTYLKTIAPFFCLYYIHLFPNIYLEFKPNESKIEATTHANESLITLDLPSFLHFLKNLVLKSTWAKTEWENFVTTLYLEDLSQLTDASFVVSSNKKGTNRHPHYLFEDHIGIFTPLSHNRSISWRFWTHFFPFCIWMSSSLCHYFGRRFPFDFFFIGNLILREYKHFTKVYAYLLMIEWVKGIFEAPILLVIDSTVNS